MIRGVTSMFDKAVQKITGPIVEFSIGLFLLEATHIEQI